jgi:hypothetical protein
MLQENIKKIKECNSKDELRKISEEFKNLDNEEKIKLRGYYIKYRRLENEGINHNK